ncbi:hypothetical protein WJR50_02565 [Catalinimonas sp. 4WD22]|uniref:hypothetical protein n=1 Tax=Catalinimonas locisalis TaxID=3133978 RepID=UPI003100B7B3
MPTNKPNSEKKSLLNIIWTGLFTLMYPFILLFSFACIGMIHLFSLLSRLISMLPIWKDKAEHEQDTQVTEGTSTWSPFAHIGPLKIESKFEDEIMFGPAYYKLKANKAIKEFSEHYFGNFQVPCFDGVLLQKWNTLTPKQLPDFDLVFLNAKTGTLHHLKTIKSFSWKVEQEADKIILWFDEKKEEGKLIIQATDLQFKPAI